jgi:broad specificity phosphatase PhoE
MADNRPISRVALAAALGGVAGGSAVALLAYWYQKRNALHMERLAAESKREQRPKRIILIRHAESEGNVDPSTYCHVPDNRMPLTSKGRNQALEAGRMLKEMIGDETAFWFVSPYTRTAQTFLGMINAFGYSSTTLPRMLRMTPQLREQDFGNFQNIEEMRKNMEDRKRFGRFWYRFPGGESGADVFDRVDSFVTTMFRQMDGQHLRSGDRHCQNYVLVTHGLTMRLICMRYLRWSVEQFEEVWNPGNTETWVLEKTAGGWYELKTDIAHGVERSPRKATENMRKARPSNYLARMQSAEIAGDHTSPPSIPIHKLSLITCETTDDALPPRDLNRQSSL